MIYATKPVIVEAHQWAGDVEALEDWLADLGVFGSKTPFWIDSDDFIRLVTNWSVVHAPGCWLVRTPGAEGAFRIFFEGEFGTLFEEAA